VSELESEIRQFIEYYNTTIAHPFDWTYTGKPLQKNQAGNGAIILGQHEFFTRTGFLNQFRKSGLGFS